MTGDRVYPMHLQFSSREYECTVTFLKVSDISIPYQSSRSFPSSRSSPARREELSKRVLKLTTLYGTGQQEIGEFRISGSECNIKQTRSYKFVSTDSISVTKLHVYVDEISNSGLTGHVTIDLKEFIGEDDSEIYLEYLLSANNSRHRTAKLQIVVQCKGPPECDNDDCLDMDLETFLYDEFSESLLESIHREPEVTHLPDPAGSISENNPDHKQRSWPLPHAVHHGLQQTSGQQQRIVVQSQILSLTDSEGDFLGLDSTPKDFVTESDRTKPLLAIGGQRKKSADRRYATQLDLHAAVFFAAGVTMQRRVHILQNNFQSTFIKMQESDDSGISSTSCGRRVLPRSQSDEFDVKRILCGPDRPLPEVATVSKEATPSKLKLNEGPFSAPCSAPPNNSEIERAIGSTTETERQRRVGYNDLVASPTVSTESKIVDVLPCPESLSPAVDVGSTATTSAEETQSLIRIPGSEPKRSAVVVVRNILGILFIAGVSFVLGAHAGFLGATSKTNTNSASKWSEIEQAGTITSVDIKLEVRRVGLESCGLAS